MSVLLTFSKEYDIFNCVFLFAINHFISAKTSEGMPTSELYTRRTYQSPLWLKATGLVSDCENQQKLIVFVEAPVVQSEGERGGIQPSVPATPDSVS